MFSAVFQCFPTVFQLFSDDVFRLLKSSSSWTKLSMMGPQLFSGWYQMILDVFRCSQLFSDVFSWVVTFMDNHPLCGHFFSGCPQLITDILYRFSDVFKICSDVLRCSQMFSDDHRCFWIFSRYSIDVLLMFSRCSLDVPRMIAGFFQDDHFKWKIQRNSMIPNYSMIPAIRWSPAIGWFPAIRWSPVIRWSIGSMDFDNPKVYGDTSISDGLVLL